MDAVSIAGLVGPTLSTLYTVTKTLYSFITSAKKVDKSLENLNGEVRGLTRALEDIETFLKDIVIAQTSHTTSMADGAWGPIYNAIKDTRRTVKALKKVLDGLGPPSQLTNGIKKTAKQIQLDFNSDEISNIKSRVQWHSTVLQMALQTATLAINCMTNDNVINVVNPKIDSLIMQVYNLSLQLTAIHNKLPKDFHTSDMTEYIQQLKQTAEATIFTASTVIDSQSTIVNGENRQRPLSFSTGGISEELRKRDIEGGISQLTVNHKELGPNSDSISELMPDDSVSSIGLDRSQQTNGAGMPGPLLGVSKSAGTPTKLDIGEKRSKKDIVEENLTHLNFNEKAAVSGEEDTKSGKASEKTLSAYRADLKVEIAYNEKSAKKLLLDLMKSLEVEEWSFNDALLEVAKTKIGQGVKSSANIVGTLLYLLEKGANVNAIDAESNTPLHHVSMGGNIAVVELLVNRNADINIQNEDGRTALHLAVEMGHYSILELLLNNGADIDQRSEKHQDTALLLSAWTGRVSTVECLLKAGASFNAGNNEGYTPLHSASGRGHVEVVEMLLKAGASINIQDNNGNTPLYVASYWGRIGAVEALLKAGASVNAVTKEGFTSLHAASDRDHGEVVEALLKAGALVDSKDDNNRTPLAYAAYYGHKTIIELLLAAGADIRARTNRRSTVLHQVFYEHPKDCAKEKCAFCAGSETRRDIVKLLCEKGADSSAKKVDGTSPSSLVSKEGVYSKSEQEALTQVLKDFGAE